MNETDNIYSRKALKKQTNKMLIIIIETINVI